MQAALATPTVVIERACLLLGQPAMNDLLLPIVLHAHLAATIYMTGLIWFVQVVHYPLFATVGTPHFPAYERRHTVRTAWVVGPPMLTELLTALLLLGFRPAAIPAWAPALGLALLSLIWLSTALLQVPCHKRLANGFDERVHRRLVQTNWIRTAGWSLRLLLALRLV